MGNTYLALKQKWQKELDDFPIKFAFSKQQFAEAIKALGLTETDTDKVYSVPGGGFIRKTDAEAFRDLFKRRSDSHTEAVAADKDGTGYIFEMFDYCLLYTSPSPRD